MRRTVGRLINKLVGKRESYHREWNLDNPSEARQFLKELRFGDQGARIKYLKDANGRDIKIDDASDEQVLQVVKELRP